MSGYDIFAWIVLLILVASAIGVFCIGWSILDMKRDWNSIFPGAGKGE